jgi:hypothetical protein
VEKLRAHRFKRNPSAPNQANSELNTSASGTGGDRTAAGRFCVFVASSDDRRDIFQIVFQNAETIWRDCDWPRYVGFTSKHPDIYGFKVLPANGPSDWRGELADQIDALSDQIEYLMLLLEDTLFMAPINASRLNAIANLMVRGDLAYVRLIPVRRNLFGLLIEYFRRKLDKRPLRPLSFSEPYYSSVAVTIWKRSHLKWLLRQPGSIWDLEHIVTKQCHYAVWRPVIDQDQIVIKGKWSLRAPRRLRSQDIKLSNSARGFRTFKSLVRDIREKIVFQTVGFLSFRVRRRLKKISHRAESSAQGNLRSLDRHPQKEISRTLGNAQH